LYIYLLCTIEFHTSYTLYICDNYYSYCNIFELNVGTMVCTLIRGRNLFSSFNDSSYHRNNSDNLAPTSHGLFYLPLTIICFLASSSANFTVVYGVRNVRVIWFIVEKRERERERERGAVYGNESSLADVRFILGESSTSHQRVLSSFVEQQTLALFNSAEIMFVFSNDISYYYIHNY